VNAPERRFTHIAERVEPIDATPCDQLPPAARDLLVLASQVPDPHERRRAIDHAIEVVQARFPEFFRQE
jgi:hypothetical protein